MNPLASVLSTLSTGKVCLPVKLSRYYFIISNEFLLFWYGNLKMFRLLRLQREHSSQYCGFLSRKCKLTIRKSSLLQNRNPHLERVYSSPRFPLCSYFVAARCYPGCASLCVAVIQISAYLPCSTRVSRI